MMEAVGYGNKAARDERFAELRASGARGVVRFSEVACISPSRVDRKHVSRTFSGALVDRKGNR